MRKPVSPQKAQRRTQKAQNTLEIESLFSFCSALFVFFFALFVVDGFLSHQTIHPYTDLLLHDMGPGLADLRAEFDADGFEWRTPPLWGIGLTYTVGGHTHFLHDGRARNLEEAILWHGGEAEDSRNAFMQLTKKEREELIAFLESL